MKKKSLLLTSMLALLSCMNVNASGDAKTPLLLTDATFNVNLFGQNNTLSGSEISMPGEYLQAGWDFTGAPKETGNFEKLVVKLTNFGPNDIQIQLDCGDDYTVTKDVKASSLPTCTTFYLHSMKASKVVNGTDKNSDGDYDDAGEKNTLYKDITTVNQVRFWTYWGEQGSTLDINEVYFLTKDGTAHDYEQADITAGCFLEGTVKSVANNNTSIALEGYGSKWGFDLCGINCSNYKYLVVVPRYKHQFGEFAPGDFQYGLKDNNVQVSSWGFAWGPWQPERALVFNLQDKKAYSAYNSTDTINGNENDKFNYQPITVPNLEYFYVNSNGTGTYSVSAVYVTNFESEYKNNNEAPSTNVAFLRETAAGSYGTVCLPYASAIFGGYAYEVSGVDSKKNPTKLYLKEVYGVLEAGKPYIYKACTDGADLGKVYFYQAGSISNATPVTTTGLTGFTDGTNTVPNDSYILSNNVWCKSAGYGKVDANRAYLTLDDVSEGAPSGAASITMDMNSGVVTGINAVQTVKAVDNATYNMNGVRVDNPTKGLYIQNGKSIIVK